MAWYVKKSMELSFAAATDVGRQRQHNEDNFLIDKKLQLFIVADGMGGHAAGEVASSITVHQVRDAVYANRDLVERFKAGDPDVQAVELLQVLEHAIQDACGTVYNRAQAEPEKRGMGTTASVLLIAGGPGRMRGFIAHVGDSRIYLARQGQCHQLTEDHSLMNELVRRGKIRREEFESSPYKQFKNAVTRAVGVYASVEVDTFDFDILPGDRFLLCSDGLYVYLDEDELPEQLSEGDVEEVPQRAHRAGQRAAAATTTSPPSSCGCGEEAPAELGERAVEVSLKIEVLKGMQLFRYLSYKELVRVMNITETRDFASGEDIIREGEPGDAMYVVLSGTVRLHKDNVSVARAGQGPALRRDGPGRSHPAVADRQRRERQPAAC